MRDHTINSASAGPGCVRSGRPGARPRGRGVRRRRRRHRRAGRHHRRRHGSDDGHHGGGASTATTAAAPATTSTPASTAPTTAAGPPKETNGFDGTNITLGLVTDNSGPLKAIAAQLTAGAQIYWDYVNQELGGVGGKYPVEVDRRRQRLRPTEVRAGLPAGQGRHRHGRQHPRTPSTQALTEFFVEDKVVAVPGSLAAEWVRNPNMLPYSAPYEIEMINGVEFWQTNLNGKGQKACTFASADAYGDSGLAGLNFAAGKLGFQFTANTTYKAGDTDFVAQVTEMKDKGCQVVFAVATPSEFNRTLASASELSFAPVWIAALPAYLALLVGADGAGAPRYANVYQVGDGPDFGDTSVAGMKTFVDRATKYNKDFKPNTFLLTGYTASIAVHASWRRPWRTATSAAQGVLTALTQLGTVDFQGLAGNYVYGPIATCQPPLKNTIFKFDVARG